MTIKEIKENNSDIYENADQKAISWIVKNKKLLKDEFKNSYPKSPFNFVVQVATKKGSILINDLGEFKKTSNVAYLDLNYLKSLGCPISL